MEIYASQLKDLKDWLVDTHYTASMYAKATRVDKDGNTVNNQPFTRFTNKRTMQNLCLINELIKIALPQVQVIEDPIISKDFEIDW